MRVTIDHTNMCTVVDHEATTATEAMLLVLQAMLGVGYQKESIIDAMATVVEENTDEQGVHDKRFSFWT